MSKKRGGGRPLLAPFVRFDVVGGYENYRMDCISWDFA